MRCKEIYKRTKIDHLAHDTFSLSRGSVWWPTCSCDQQSTSPEGGRGAGWPGAEADSNPEGHRWDSTQQPARQSPER